MNRATRILRTLLSVAVVAGLAPAVFAQVAADVVTIDSVSGWGEVEVPVYIRDVSGSPLGADQPAGSHIQSFSLTVHYSPASAVDSISFSRAGITTALTPAFETSTSGTGTVSLIENFDEGSNPIPFTSDAAQPGNPVAHLIVQLSPNLNSASIVTLTLDSGLTVLTDEDGSPGTEETAGNGTLQLVDGEIHALPPVPTLDPWALLMLGVALATTALWARRG